MDRRSWPWKKKSSEKTSTTTDSTSTSSPNLVGNQEDQVFPLPEFLLSAVSG